MTILVTGGAGYIGSFMVKKLLDEGNTVVVLDSLERGQEEKIDKRATFRQGTLLDKSFVEQVFTEFTFDSVVHFAAYISVAESMKEPQKYFINNVFGTVTLLDAMVKRNVKKIVFSSTAAVYGNPQQVPIPEDHTKNPESPYGESKLMVENILKWYQQIHGIRFVVLRYFNASGASLDGSMGESHTPETHIIPCAIEAVLNKNPFTLFGDDYKTADGTCIRDYIHVLDLVEAHTLSLARMEKRDGGAFYNVGTGKGYSNREVWEMVKKVSETTPELTIAPRRPGDPDELVADATRIQQELGFVPQYSDLQTIVSSAWAWHKKLKD